jgi:hypothetical protein
MPKDKNNEPVVVEVLPKDWDKPDRPRNRAMEKVDMSSPLTWLLIPPALIFAFGFLMWAVGMELQRRAGMLDDKE